VVERLVSLLSLHGGPAAYGHVELDYCWLDRRLSCQMDCVALHMSAIVVATLGATVLLFVYHVLFAERGGTHANI